MTVILGTIVAGQYGLQGMFVACFMAGFILLIAGIFRLGKLIDFIPKPVITGFTSGIAIVIALGQLGNFFGVKLVGETTIDKVIYFFRLSIGDINWKTVLCSLAVILIMVLFPKKWGKVIPSSLVAIILITLATTLLKLDVAKIGQIPASMLNSERLNFSSLSVDMVTSLIGPAFTIAVLGMIESLLCGVSAANMKKESFDADIELVAQGVGNLIVPILGGVPSTAAIARTSVAIKSGGQTRVASIIQSLFLIACMFLLSPLIAYVPYAALAGVLVVTAVKMNDWKDIKHYFSRKLWSSIVLFLITMVATVALDLTYAIFIGVGLSFIMFVVKLRTVDVYS
jgi:SulP family sulfate permease